MSINAMSWTWKLKIKSGMKLVLLALADHANDDDVCWPGIESLADKCSLSRISVIKHLNQLIKLELVSKDRRYNSDGFRTSNCYHLNLSKETLCKESLRKDFDSLGKDLPLPYVKNLNPNHKEPSEEPKDISQLKIQEIFQYWQTKLNHPEAKLDNKRKQVIKRAMKNYSMEAVKQAIDGCSLSPFNMGENDSKKKYDNLDLIFRDADHVEQFVSIAKNPPPVERSQPKDPLIGGF